MIAVRLLRFLTLAALLLANAMPASADQPVTLWRNLMAGMPKKDALALYPNFQAEIYPKCPVRVLSSYKDKRLVSVILLGRDKETNCSDQILKDFTEKYGKGTEETHGQSSLFATGVLSRSFQRRDVVWNAEGRQVRLSIMPGNPLGYNLIFTVRTDGQLY